MSYGSRLCREGMTEGDICEEENNNLCGVSLVIILVLLSVNFLQSGTGSISKENNRKRK